MASPMLASTDKVPLGNSPVTGQSYFPISFNCMKEIHQLTQASAKDVGKLGRPIKVGDFSLDGDRKFCDDQSQLRYFSPPV